MYEVEKGGSDPGSGGDSDGEGGGQQGGVMPPLTRATVRTPYRSNAPAPSSGLLKAQLKLKPRSDGHGVEVEAIDHELDFDKGFFMVMRAIQLLARQNENPLSVVGLAGPSGAGKSHLAKRLLDFIPGCEIICMDDYLDTTQLKDGNFDDPKLTDFDLLLENLQTLKAGQPAEVPCYSFKESRRTGYRTVCVPSSRVLIVEGIYALHGAVRNYIDLSVSIHGGVHFDLIKRIQRDLSRTEQNPQDVLQQISETVYPMYKAFIEPDLQQATIRIRNGFNPFSGFLKRVTYTLKSDKKIEQADAERILGEWGGKPLVAKDEETTDIYFLPPNEDQETCKDWIRMRLRNGRYWMSFEEYLTDGPMMISPRMSFDVSVRVLSGLMSLGYTIGAIVKRVSQVYPVEKSTEKGTIKLVVKFDTIEQLDKNFISISSSSREGVERVGEMLQLEGTYVPRSYIEEVQLKRLTQEFAPDIEDLRRAIEARGPQSVFTPPASPPPRAPTNVSGSPGGTGIAMLQAQQRHAEVARQLKMMDGRAGKNARARAGSPDTAESDEGGGGGDGDDVGDDFMFPDDNDHSAGGMGATAGGGLPRSRGPNGGMGGGGGFGGDGGGGGRDGGFGGDRNRGADVANVVRGMEATVSRVREAVQFSAGEKELDDLANALAKARRGQEKVAAQLARLVRVVENRGVQARAYSGLDGFRGAGGNDSWGSSPRPSERSSANWGGGGRRRGGGRQDDTLGAALVVIVGVAAGAALAARWL